MMAFQLRTFQGVRFGLFNYTTRGVDGGTCAFDAFTVDESRPAGLTRPIPYGSTITLTSVADSSVLVHWRNSLRPVPAGSPFAAGQKAHFLVIDRGNGRVALRSLTDSSYVTVTGAGRLSEVQFLDREPGDASTFQWVDIGDGTLALMSLATHTYLRVDPYAGGLCKADATGIDPDRRTGPCFTWTLAAY
jgi:hypothetical protein